MKNKMKVTKGITRADIDQIRAWTNPRGADFLRQWVGRKSVFPLTAEFLEEQELIYSIFWQEQFVGMIQVVSYDEKNAHVGRFFLNPDETGHGIGTEALNQFCEILFREFGVDSITLHVYTFNTAAQKCYRKCGFERMDDQVYDGGLGGFYKMIRKRNE